jgi:hypothetical protein
MKDVFYDASSFLYDKENKTFTGNSWEIWDMDNKYAYPFPTGRKQFCIKNSKTGGFRRFRFISEIENMYISDLNVLSLIKNMPSGIHIQKIKAMDALLIFESEDGITCIIHHKEKELLNKEK